MRSLYRFLCLCILLYSQHLLAQDSVTIGFKTKIHSDILKEDREILIHVPPGFPAPGKNYAVAYLLDAEINFSYFSTVSAFLSRGLRGRIPELIVVGIVNTGRTKDLTPTKSFVPDPNNKGKKLFEDSGGSEAFLNFIQNELKPFIRKRYPGVSEEILVGHSFGGLTVLDCLLNHPGYFNSYVSNDPSLWWDDGYEVKLAAKKWKETPELFSGRKLFLSHSGGTAQPGHFGGNSEAVNSAFSALLKQAKTGLQWKEKTFSEETHGTVSLPANIDALKFLYGL